MASLTSVPARHDLTEHPKVLRQYEQLNTLIGLLQQRSLPAEVVEQLNQELAPLRDTTISPKKLGSTIRKVQGKMVRTLEKKLKLVPKGYYRTLWTGAGMAAFGLPLGTALGIATNNMGLLAVGLPFGIGIGLSLGNGMDKKAADEGRQLDIELKA